MPSPLNPQLHNALLKAFGDVHIANEGETFIPSKVIYRGRQSSEAAHSGEYYSVDCPFCHGRKKLWINHMWGVNDQGEDHLYLAWCYRCEQPSIRETQKELREQVFPFSYGLRQKRSDLPTATSPSEGETISAPTPVAIPVGLLRFQDDVAASAADYLRERGFDPFELDEKWGVRYCPYANNVKPRILDRIVIPIYTLRRTLQFSQTTEVVLAGWQSRCIGDDPSGTPKYMCMQGLKKSQLLYGLPQAVDTTGPVVIVEGVTDVWRLGSRAVAVLGKAVSRTQQQLLVRHFPGRPIVVFFDDGAKAEGNLAAAAIRAIRQEYGDRAPVVVATPPAGRDDVGACMPDEAWAAVWAALPGK
ncbi:hypothetical protein [Lignipirellula cremea]|uniref:DNA primase n=1 Tax=Lignipirellula cremea TaxID=2528010 RepID=A0A518E3Y2_9BACT|nr:hypothetical protein [Lignipirellula cremea]QDU98772.1 DNA primase [Lignipirellula cremea]